ncbi:MAG TPA: MMPL family transporter, partial [Polyangiaceae bacterium]
FVGERDWEKLNELLPSKKLEHIGIAQLPEQVALPFTEKDGTRGRLVYIEPSRTRSLWDGHYLIEWAESFRETKLPDGSVVKGSGRSVIFADMILAIVEDAPRAIVMSLVATLAILMLAFRSTLASGWVIGSLLTGLMWTVGVMSVWNTSWQGHLEVEPMRLNFLNFVALPITIGVGADYAVNVLQRYRIAGGNLRRVIVETGGAVTLCSMTTTLGYLALTLSVNRGIKSFGIAAAAGEICTLLTGVVVLPACLELVSRYRHRVSKGSIPP